jgi:transposase
MIMAGRKRKPREPLRELSEHERQELERAVRARNTPKSLDLRARIILAAVKCEHDYEIAYRLGCDHRTVRKWIGRFNAQGLAGLRDAPRPGQPRRYGPEVRLEVVALLSRDPRGVLGAKAQGRSSWTLQLLSEALLATGYTHRLIPVSVLHAWLHEADVRFKQAKRWLHSTDPQFEPKKGRS